MNKFPKKGVLLFTGALAICAFVMPSTASAASWGPIGLHTGLHSFDFGFTSTSPAFGPVSALCTRSSFTANVVSATNLNISSISVGGHCIAIFTAVPATCTMTTASTTSPWQGTAPTTSDIQIHNVRIDLRFEHTPGNPQCGTANGLTGLLTGTQTGGQWTGNAVGQRSITYFNDEGLMLHASGISTTVTARGTFAATGALTAS